MNRRNIKQRGFTLAELIVVVSIVVVISGIILVNYSKFGGTVVLRNLAYDVALTIREAQVYGISGRSSLSAASSAGHGIYMDLDAGDNFFYLFTDTDGNGLYNSAVTEWLETYNIEKNYAINEICVQVGFPSENCTITKLSILFRRPEPDAIIYAGTDAVMNQYSNATITLRSPRGNTLRVAIESTGQISVQK